MVDLRCIKEIMKISKNNYKYLTAFDQQLLQFVFLYNCSNFYKFYKIINLICVVWLNSSTFCVCYYY